MTAVAVEKRLKAAKLRAVQQFKVDYNNKEHDAQWAQAPNPNKEVSNGCFGFFNFNYLDHHSVHADFWVTLK